MRLKTGHSIDQIEELRTDIIKLVGRKIWAVQILKYLLEIDRNLKMGESELKSYQDSKLRRIISHAFQTVFYYRELLKKNKIDPSSIQGISDLNRLPIINKDILREVPFKERISQSYLGKPLCSYFTSGSTGKPFKIYLSEEHDKKRVANLYRIFFLHGYNIFDKTARVVGMVEKVRKRWFHRLGLLRKVKVPYDCSVADQVQFILNYKPEIIEAYPNRLNLIAQHIGDNHITISKPKAIITSSETLFPDIRMRIEDVFGVEVTNVYDSWEFGQIAWECQKHKGLHLNSDSLIVQIVKDNMELEDGERGEIVVTDLDNYAMPLIRYNIGDIGIKTREKCDCGIAFPMLESVLGRSNDFVFSPGGEKIFPLIIDQIVRDHKGISEYQIIQNSLGTLIVEMVVSKDYDYDSDVQIRQKLKDLYQFKEIVINHPVHIKRTDTGKFKSVICNYHS